MNLPVSPPVSRPPMARDARLSQRQPEPRDVRPRSDAFDRLLRQKSGDADDARDDETEAPAMCLPAGAPSPVWPDGSAVMPRRATASAAASGAGSTGGVPEPSTTAAKAGREAALDGGAGAAAVPGMGQDTAQAFEVTLNDPRGLGLEMRAQRPGGLQTSSTAAPWSLTIGSGVFDASVLSRHAPRLNERLQARAVTHSHVRIDDQPDRQGDRGGEQGARR